MNTNSRRQAAENQTLFQLQNPLNNLRFFQKVMLILPGMKAGWLPAMLEENVIAREVQAAPAQVAAHAELSQCRIRVVGQQPQHHGIERGPWWGLPCHCPPPPPSPHRAAACKERRSRLHPRRSAVNNHRRIFHYFQRLWKQVANSPQC